MNQNMNESEEYAKPTFHTTARMPAGSIIALAVVLALVLCGLNVLFLTGENAIELKTALLIDAAAVVLSVLLILYGIRSNRWTLDFAGDELHLTNGFRKSYVNYDSPLSEMQMKLTNAARNEGKLVIAGTIFRIEGVQNFTEMQAYVEANYRK